MAAISMFSLLGALGEATEQPASAGIAWAGGVGVAIVLVLIGLLLFPSTRVAWKIRLLAVGFGALFATFAAGVLNPVESAVLAPFGEELCKGAVIVTLLWIVRGQLRGPLDGLIAGYFTGLGFEAFEDVGYITGVTDQNAAWNELFERAIVGFGLHNIFSALTGIGIALLLIRGRRAWGSLLGLFAAAIALHFIWDNTPLPIPYELSVGIQISVSQLTYYVVFLAVFVWAYLWARRNDQRGHAAL